METMEKRERVSAALNLLQKNDYYFSKDKLVQAAFGTSYPKGFDYAIPQYWVDQHPDVDLWPLMTDCNTSCYQIIDVRDKLSDDQVKALEDYATFYSNLVARDREATPMSPELIKEYNNQTKNFTLHFLIKDYYGEEE